MILQVFSNLNGCMILSSNDSKFHTAADKALPPASLQLQIPHPPPAHSHKGVRGAGTTPASGDFLSWELLSRPRTTDRLLKHRAYTNPSPPSKAMFYFMLPGLERLEPCRTGWPQFILKLFPFRVCSISTRTRLCPLHSFGLGLVFFPFLKIPPGCQSGWLP